MKCKICTPGMKNFALLLARVLVGVVFIQAGWAKLSGFEGTVGMFESFGYPAPSFFAGLVGVAELVGGVMVLLGIWTTFASAVLAVVMLVAVLSVHLPGGDSLVAMRAPLGLLAATAALMASGGGDWKVLKKDCAC